MKNKRLLLQITLLITFILGNSNFTFGQNDDSETLYKWFDKEIGTNNSSINNGPVHVNYDRTQNNEHRYLEKNEFVVGSVHYDNQDYYDAYLKYDISNDELILDPKNLESKYIIINLIKENVKRFSFYNKTFVQLTNLPEGMTKGFYEENLKSKSFTFYIKHYKQKNTLAKDEGVILQYVNKKEYVLFYKDKFEKINPKKAIINLFPEYKTKINDFYLMNEYLEKENKLKFMENLMIYMNNLNMSESN